MVYLPFEEKSSGEGVIYRSALASNENKKAFYFIGREKGKIKGVYEEEAY
jgi:hypothetical protein